MTYGLETKQGAPTAARRKLPMTSQTLSPDHFPLRAAVRALVSSTFRAGDLDAYRAATQQLRDLDAVELNAACRTVST